MKGISPVIASVLLIALTVGIAAIVVNWAGSYTKAKTSEVSSASDTRCAGIAVSFESEPSLTSDGDVTMKLSNIGTSDFNCTKEVFVWADGGSTTNTTQFYIEKGGYKEVTVHTGQSNKQLSQVRLYSAGCDTMPVVWKATA